MGELVEARFSPDDEGFDADFEPLAASVEEKLLCNRLDDAIEICGWLQAEISTRRFRYRDEDLPDLLRRTRKALIRFQSKNF